MDGAGRQSLIRDENGKLSSARASFWLSLLFTMAVIAVDGLTRASFPGEAYTLLGTVITFTAVWAAGPRMARNLAPQIGAAVGAIATAARAKRGLDDRFRDDERGDVR